MAAEVAAELEGVLGAVPARKIGSPMSAELAIGAVAPGGVEMIDSDMVRRLGISADDLRMVVARAHGELEERFDRYGSMTLEVEDEIVVVVDDGVATGATLRAVLRYVRSLSPRLLVCAVPVGPPATVDILIGEVDELVCPAQPDRFRSVGEWYEDFTQTSDEDVVGLLRDDST